MLQSGMLAPGQPGMSLGSHQIDAERHSLTFSFLFWQFCCDLVQAPQMATGPAAGTTRGDEPPRLPGISQLQQAEAVAALLLMLPLLKGAAPKKGEPLPVSIPPPPLTPPPFTCPPPTLCSPGILNS